MWLKSGCFHAFFLPTLLAAADPSGDRSAYAGGGTDMVPRGVGASETRESHGAERGCWLMQQSLPELS